MSRREKESKGGCCGAVRQRPKAASTIKLDAQKKASQLIKGEQPKTPLKSSIIEVKALDESRSKLVNQIKKVEQTNSQPKELSEQEKKRLELINKIKTGRVEDVQMIHQACTVENTLVMVKLT